MMIYGYNFKLFMRNIGILKNYSREFLEKIRKIRAIKFVKYEIVIINYYLFMYNRDKGFLFLLSIILETLYSLV